MNKLYKKLNVDLQEKIYKKLFKYVKLNQRLVLNQLNKFFRCLDMWSPPNIEAHQFNVYLGYIKLLYLVQLYCPEVKHKNIIKYWTKFVLWRHKQF